ncbi:hypothetical protein MPF19_10120 [Polaribacter sp. Z014]|uniref:hypothetical protein n=1 Tax=Polaribacter sp. Z014 TaxID=2927126 RepID=UPI0020208837|nr:hypothetical protein [Polaribacter sp. Z014]MCL7763771.1 hypothetical protein [Polaribacter sp. Z014]
MKIYYFILFFILSNSISSQNFEIIAKGSYVNKLNDDPMLLIFFHQNDSLKIYTNNQSVLNLSPKPKKIISIDVLKDEKAKKLFGEFGKNGVILINSKKKYWKQLSSYKNNLTSNTIAIEVLKTLDTIFLKNIHPNIQFEQELILNNYSLKTRKKGENHISNNLKLYLTSNKQNSISDKIIINLERVKEIMIPKISFNHYSQNEYSLIYDLDTNKLIWNFRTYKNDKNGKEKYQNSKGFYTVEIIEIDALNGNLINQRIDDKVQIMIR